MVQKSYAVNLCARESDRLRSLFDVVSPQLHNSLYHYFTSLHFHPNRVTAKHLNRPNSPELFLWLKLYKFDSEGHQVSPEQSLCSQFTRAGVTCPLTSTSSIISLNRHAVQPNLRLCRAAHNFSSWKVISVICDHHTKKKISISVPVLPSNIALYICSFP